MPIIIEDKTSNTAQNRARYFLCQTKRIIWFIPINEHLNFLHILPKAITKTAITKGSHLLTLVEKSLWIL